MQSDAGYCSSGLAFIADVLLCLSPRTCFSWSTWWQGRALVICCAPWSFSRGKLVIAQRWVMQRVSVNKPWMLCVLQCLPAETGVVCWNETRDAALGCCGEKQLSLQHHEPSRLRRFCWKMYFGQMKLKVWLYCSLASGKDQPEHIFSWAS